MLGKARSSTSEADGYSTFMGELHRIKGELWEKVAELDPSDPAQDCRVALQVPVNHPLGTAYLYPTPLEASSAQEITGLEYTTSYSPELLVKTNYISSDTRFSICSNFLILNKSKISNPPVGPSIG